MQGRIITSARTNIIRSLVPWRPFCFYHRESKVGGHTVRSVPVRGGATVEAPAAPVSAVVDNEDLQRAMSALSISELTEIQELAYPLILDKKDVMVASHTGSGKTLAYLLPIAQELKRQELQDGFVGKPRRPRVIVLSPTRELTDQIAGVSRQLSHHVKLRTVILSTGIKPSQQKRALTSPLDILVSTPQHIVAQMSEGSLAISDVQYLVLDEADTIFEGGFGQDIYSIIRPLRKRGTPVATVLVSATMNPQLKQAVEAEFPEMVKAETASLHKAIKGSNHVFMPLQPGQDKLQALFQVLASAQGKRCMVFCSSMSSCRAVDYFLSEGGVSTVCFHGDMPIPDRKTAIERFTQSSIGSPQDTLLSLPPGEADDGSPRDLPSLQMDDMEDGVGFDDQPVLVCTDLAARGLDMPAKVHHVINFDFPVSAKDYLHRSGRTARAGATGTVTSLLQTALERSLASRIEQGLKNNEAIDQLTVGSILAGRGEEAARASRSKEGGRGRSTDAGEGRGRGREGGRGAGRGTSARWSGGTGRGSGVRDTTSTKRGGGVRDTTSTKRGGGVRDTTSTKRGEGRGRGTSTRGGGRGGGRGDGRGRGTGRRGTGTERGTGRGRGSGERGWDSRSSSGKGEGSEKEKGWSDERGPRFTEGRGRGRRGGGRGGRSGRSEGGRGGWGASRSSGGRGQAGRSRGRSTGRGAQKGDMGW